MEEEWKYYKTTDSKRWGHRVYEVSNFGHAKLNGELIEFDESARYYGIAGAYLHKIVAELFIPNPENKPHVDHIDTNTHNNRVDNLRWCTQKENCANPLTRQHMSESMKGEKNPMYGKTSWNKGISPSIDTRQKQSKSMKGKYKGRTSWNKGISLSEETRQKQSKSKKGEKNPMYGKHQSEAAKQKMKEAWARRKAKKRQHHD